METETKPKHLEVLLYQNPKHTEEALDIVSRMEDVFFNPDGKVAISLEDSLRLQARIKKLVLFIIQQETNEEPSDLENLDVVWQNLVVSSGISLSKEQNKIINGALSSSFTFSLLHLMHDPSFLEGAAMATHYEYTLATEGDQSKEFDLTEEQKDANVSSFVATQEMISLMAAEKEIAEEVLIKEIIDGEIGYEDWYAFVNLQKTLYLKNRQWTGEALFRDYEAVDGSSSEHRMSDWSQVYHAVSYIAEKLGISEIGEATEDKLNKVSNHVEESTFVETSHPDFIKKMQGIMNSQEFLNEVAAACDGAYKLSEVTPELVESMNPEGGDYNWMFETDADGYIINESGIKVDLSKSIEGENFPAAQKLLSPEQAAQIVKYSKALKHVVEVTSGDQVSREAAKIMFSKMDDSLKKPFQNRTINLSGVHATFAVVTHVSNLEKIDPDVVLKDLASDESRYMSTAMRFAHATWYQDQTWRNRELGEIVQPFDILTDQEQSKDAVQIKTSAQEILKNLPESSTE